MAALPENYLSYSKNDFINDPFFQDWVLHPTMELNTFWQQFVATHPAKASDIESAARFLKNLRFVEHTIPEQRIKALYQEHITSVKLSAKTARLPIRHQIIRALAVAALVAGLIFGTYFFLYQRSENQQVALDTSYGEKKEVVLPDSSLIVLNGHSQIKYAQQWKTGKAREIWLEGDAYFDVKHLNNNSRNIRAGERFIVHAKNLTIEVLGTAFNVRQRRDRTEIVLQRGSIKVNISNKAHTQLMMKPGDLISYTEADEAVIQTVIDPKAYVAWKENKLVLVNPTLTEITRYLEDNYGKKILITDPKLAGKKIAGPILLNNLDDALFIISTVLKTKVEKGDSLIVIGKN